MLRVDQPGDAGTMEARTRASAKAQALDGIYSVTAYANIRVKLD